MSLRVPDSLTASHSENYRTSVRLWPGGLSFSGGIPSDEGSFFYAETEVDAAQPYLQALRDLFRQHPFLTYPYASVRVVTSEPNYTWVPEVIYEDEAKERLYRFSFAGAVEEVLAQPLKAMESVLLFGLRHDLHEFVLQTIHNARWEHGLASLLQRWHSRSLRALHAEVYAIVHDRTMDVACFDRGALRFLNRFEVETHDDIMYYLLYAWKQLSLDQRGDTLTLSAVASTAFDLKEKLQTYLRNIRVEAIETLYRADDREATLGNQAEANAVNA